MSQTQTAVAYLLAHGLQRIGHVLAVPGLRAVAGHLASLAFPLAIRPAPAASSSAQGPVARLLRLAGDVYALARGRDARARAAEATHQDELAEAQRLADEWRGRAEMAERRIADLEAQLAASEITALDLRSRVVCLHGKLATTTATVRYQTMTLALGQDHKTSADAPRSARH